MFYEPLYRSLLAQENPFNSTDEVRSWIAERNRDVRVSVTEIPFDEMRGWHFDPDRGDLVHDTGRFFSVVGLDVMTNAGKVHRWSQPIINQPEVGILGILAKEFDGVLYFLLQAKIEPGNVNCVQLSPTLQATRSNYTQVHGGRRPAYLEYFLNANSSDVLVDQLQSEQGARFLRKRNRNIIVKTDDSIVAGDDFRWLTLGQIRQLITENNMVNMDTRTVLSGLRVNRPDESEDRPCQSVDMILHRISKLKTAYELVAERIPLRKVRDWVVTKSEIVRHDRQFFRVMGVNVTISNREVSSWAQPLVQPMQAGLCVLFCQRIGGVMHYLLQAKIECGNFDVVELAPTIQCLTGNYELEHIKYWPTYVKEFVEGRIGGRCLIDVVQSEEGGRFYREQNRNVVFELDESVDLPFDERFIWMTMPQIKEFLRFNNYLNVQVRSLIAAL